MVLLVAPASRSPPHALLRDGAIVVLPEHELVMIRALALLALCGLGCNEPTSGSVAQADPTPAAVDPLPSWNDGATKHGITEFVDRVTRDHGPDFVPVEDRVAVFDNDGTLSIEKPYPVRTAFAFDRIKVLAPQHAMTDILGAVGEGSGWKRDCMEILARRTSA